MKCNRNTHFRSKCIFACFLMLVTAVSLLPGGGVLTDQVQAAVANGGTVLLDGDDHRPDSMRLVEASSMKELFNALEEEGDVYVKVMEDMDVSIDYNNAEENVGRSCYSLYMCEVASGNKVLDLNGHDVELKNNLEAESPRECSTEPLCQTTLCNYPIIDYHDEGFARCHGIIQYNATVKSSSGQKYYDNINYNDLTMFRLTSGSDLVVTSSAGGEGYINYDGYMSGYVTPSSMVATWARNIFEVDTGACLTVNRGVIEPGRSKEQWVTAFMDTSSYNGKNTPHYTGNARQQIYGSAVIANGGTVIINGGYLYGRGGERGEENFSKAMVTYPEKEDPLDWIYCWESYYVWKKNAGLEDWLKAFPLKSWALEPQAAVKIVSDTGSTYINGGHFEGRGGANCVYGATESNLKVGGGEFSTAKIDKERIANYSFAYCDGCACGKIASLNFIKEYRGGWEETTLPMMGEVRNGVRGEIGIPVGCITLPEAAETSGKTWVTWGKNTYYSSSDAAQMALDAESLSTSKLTVEPQGAELTCGVLSGTCADSYASENWDQISAADTAENPAVYVSGCDMTLEYGGYEEIFPYLEKGAEYAYGYDDSLSGCQSDWYWLVREISKDNTVTHQALFGGPGSEWSSSSLHLDDLCEANAWSDDNSDLLKQGYTYQIGVARLDQVQDGIFATVSYAPADEYFSFTVTEGIPVETVELSKCIGESSGFSPDDSSKLRTSDVSDDAGYYFTTEDAVLEGPAEWWVDGQRSDSVTAVEANEHYLVGFRVTPLPGYYFTEDTKIIVSSEPEEEQICLYNTEGYIDFYYSAYGQCDHTASNDTYEKGTDTHYRVCSICGERMDEEDHIWGKPVDTGETVGNATIYKHTCTLCGYEDKYSAGDDSDTRPVMRKLFVRTSNREFERYYTVGDPMDIEFYRADGILDHEEFTLAEIDDFGFEEGSWHYLGTESPSYGDVDLSGYPVVSGGTFDEAGWYAVHLTFTVPDTWQLTQTVNYWVRVVGGERELNKTIDFDNNTVEADIAFHVYDASYWSFSAPEIGAGTTLDSLNTQMQAIADGWTEDFGYTIERPEDPEYLIDCEYDASSDTWKCTRSNGVYCLAAVLKGEMTWAEANASIVSENLTPSDVFVLGASDYVTLNLSAYIANDDVTLYVPELTDHTEAEYTMVPSTTGLSFKAVYTSDAVIKYIDLQIPEVVDGQMYLSMALEDITFSDERYEVDSVVTQALIGGSWVTVNSGTYNCGNTYRNRIRLVPKTGYSFATAAGQESTQTKGYLNGVINHDTPDAIVNTGSYVTVTKTYTAEHQLVYQFAEQEAGCTTTGTDNYKCSQCGCNVELTTPALGHTLISLSAKSATCTETGMAADLYYCTVCGKYFPIDTENPENSENYYSGNPVLAVDPAAHPSDRLEWSFDLTGHRQACSDCGAAVGSVQSHSFVTNEIGIQECSVCGFQVFDTKKLTVTNGSILVDNDDGTQTSCTSMYYNCTGAVHIVAKVPSGKIFDHWEVTAGTPTQLDTTQEDTYFFMPAENVSLKAVFSDTPAAPDSLTAQVADSWNVCLTWSASKGATKYGVYRSGDGGSTWTPVDEKCTALTCTDKTAVPGTEYSYTVRAGNSNGWGPYADYAFATVTTVPGAPVLVSAIQSTGGVTVKWKSTKGASSYRVYRRSTDSNTWSTVCKTQTGCSYVDNTADSGTSYYYTVKARNANGWGSYSKEGILSNYTPTLTSAANAAEGVTVRWKAVAGAVNYRVFYKTSSSNWSKGGDTTGTSLTVKGLTSGTNYTFTVRCLNAAGTAYTSNYNSYKSIKYVGAPVISSLKPSETSVTVKWGAMTGAGAYRVFYRKAGGNWITGATTTATSATVKGLTSGTTYTFTVRCMNSAKTAYVSGYNSGESCTCASSAAAVPDNVTLVSAVPEKDGITVNWKPAANAKTYRVYRKNSSGGWDPLTSTESGTSFKDKTAEAGTTYTYTVKGLNGSLSSKSYDKTGVSAMIPTAVPAKVVMTGAAADSSGITVEWQAADTATLYRLYIRGGSYSGWTKFQDLSGTSFTVPQSKLDSGTTYSFTVRAYNCLGWSASYDTTGVSATAE